MKINIVALVALGTITSAAKPKIDNNKFDILDDPLAHQLIDVLVEHRSIYYDVERKIRGIVDAEIPTAENIAAVASAVNTGLKEVEQMVKKADALVEHKDHLVKLIEAKYL